LILAHGVIRPAPSRIAFPRSEEPIRPARRKDLIIHSRPVVVLATCARSSHLCRALSSALYRVLSGTWPQCQWRRRRVVVNSEGKWFNKLMVILSQFDPMRTACERHCVNLLRRPAKPHRLAHRNRPSHGCRCFAFRGSAIPTESDGVSSPRKPLEGETNYTQATGLQMFFRGNICVTAGRKKIRCCTSDYHLLLLDISSHHSVDNNRGKGNESHCYPVPTKKRRFKK
jgi:hypothetical protein